MKKITLVLIVFLNLSCSITKSIAQNEDHINKQFKTELNILIDYLEFNNNNVKFFNGYRYVDIYNPKKNISFYPNSVADLEDYKTYFEYRDFFFFLDEKMEYLYGFKLKNIKDFDCKDCPLEGPYIDESDFFIYEYSKGKLTLKSVFINYYEEYQKIRKKYSQGKL